MSLQEPSSRWATLPNALSAARLGTAPVFLRLFLTGREDAAVILYGAGAVTDFWDGYLARRTHSVSKLGALLDPVADRVFIATLAGALVSRGDLAPCLAVSIVGRDVLVVVGFGVLERRGVSRIAVNRTGKAATASLLAGLSLLATSATSFMSDDGPRRLGVLATTFGAGLYWIAAMMYGREALDRIATNALTYHLVDK
ncbi:MAG: CDP-alcohol phosphatidyltransferase family protein [Actinobacteria bacterium]|nr:CDP-alcohol phosphatidyltransferase family protein [Actinomycetota bacterium]